jgi:phosphoribosylformylglycinamidine synthase subunit PurS
MKTFRAAIQIQLRQQILDVQGKTVEQALHSMSFAGLNSVRVGKYVELTVQAVDKAQALLSVEEACRKLIANPVMEDFSIELTEA